jgi:cytoskeletal protein RodZ
MSKKIALKSLLVVVVVLFIVSYIYLLGAYFKVQKTMTPEEVKTTVNAVSKLIKVDNSQEPLVATIQDASALAAEQEFYKPAKNGDILVVYQDKAIIYRPQENILVNVGPVLIQNTKLNIELRNGTSVSGAALEMRDELAKVHTITKVAQASSADFDGVTIVNLKNVDVTALQEQYDAKVVNSMPVGEAPSTADVVIIRGS